MRPRELTLKGFRSYREQTTFDFRGRRLIGVVGPIGAGKSSILDAIVFALYGKTPTFESNTKSLIHQLCDAAQVELLFEVEGQTWRIQRGLRRKGASQHKIERLAEDDRDAEVLETIPQERATRERVEQLLGMGFDAFCRSVLLAQNRFAEFLKAPPTQRNDVLKGVFGYERFDAALVAAKERVAGAEGELRGLDDERRLIEEARATLEDARTAATSATSLEATLGAAREQVEDLDRRRVGAAEDEATATALLERWRAIAEGLPGADAIDAAIDAATDAAAAIETTAAQVQSAEDRARDAEAERDELAASLGDLREFGELAARLDQQAAAVREAAAARATALARATTTQTVAERASTAEAAAAADVERADRGVAAAAAALATADGALHEARHRSMADELRRHLEIDEPCPVCAQRVTAAVKPGKGAAAVATAERARAKADAAHAKAQSMATTARTTAASAAAASAATSATAEEASAAAKTADAAAEEATIALARTKSELVDRLGEGDPRALLDERERALRDAETRLKEATRAIVRARTDLDAARRTSEASGAALASLAAKLAGSWGLLGETREVGATSEPLRAAFIELGEHLLAVMTEQTEAAGRAHDEAAAAASSLGAILGDLGFADAAAFAASLHDAEVAVVATRERVRVLESAIEAGGDIDERVAALTQRRDLAVRLRDDLQPSRLLAFALEEERAALAELGSVHLDELTAGSFRFADDDSFKVEDVNAGGQVRSADSLSGGETFLASLALALALAEMVTRGGGRMDAFLLDEGFGSLDAEHLDRAMDGIGRLVAGGQDRLVVLVSHVDQMRQVIEDLIVLDKDERTGDTRVLAGATVG